MLELNDPLYNYVHRVADEIMPEFYMEEDGEYYQMPSNAPDVFRKRLARGKVNLPFTYQQFIHNEEIVATLEGYELDIETFWYAVMFIYDITQEKCINTLTFGDSIKVQAEHLRDALSGVGSFTLTSEHHKNLKIDDLALIRDLHRYLDELLSRCGEGLNHHSIHLTAAFSDLYSSSVQLWFAASRFLALFESLHLPDKRSKNVTWQYREIEGESIATRGEMKTVSLSKKLLVSRLVYFMRYTRNDTFLYSDNSLKGILKQYKDYKLKSFSKDYFA